LHVQSHAGVVHDERDMVPLSVVDPFLLQVPRRPIPTLFPYTTLFRSAEAAAVGEDLVAVEGAGEIFVDDAAQTRVRRPDPGRDRDRKGTDLKSGHVSDADADSGV